MIKTAKITAIKNVKPWTGKNGVTLYHLLELDNGEKIELGKKKELQVGWEVSYSYKDNDTQQEFRKCVPERKPDHSPSHPQNNNKPYISNDNRTDAILYQTCLKAATEALTTMYDPQWETTQITAGYINAFALELAQGAKANIEKL